jgi:hypothetical protein
VVGLAGWKGSSKRSLGKWGLGVEGCIPLKTSVVGGLRQMSVSGAAVMVKVFGGVMMVVVYVVLVEVVLVVTVKSWEWQMSSK